MFLCFSVSLFLCFFVSLFLCLFIYFFICHFFICLYNYLFVYLFIYLFFHMIIFFLCQYFLISFSFGILHFSRFLWKSIQCALSSKNIFHKINELWKTRIWRISFSSISLLQRGSKVHREHHCIKYEVPSHGFLN